MENSILHHLVNNSIQNSVCRLCLKSNVNMLKIHENVEENHETISKMVEILTSIKLNQEENYPEVICIECLEKVIEISQFRIKCQESSAILKKCIELYKEIKEKPSKVESNEDSNLFIPFDLDTANEEDIEDKYSEDSFNKYTCQHCHESFSNFAKLQLHIESFTHESQCRMCRKMCRNKKSLKKHYKKHRVNKEMLCPFCEGFVKKGIHSDDLKFVCHYCNFTYPCKHFLEKHIMFEHHDGVVRKRTFDSSCVFTKRTKDEPLENKCLECNRLFKSIRHLNLHIAANNCKYICDYCSISYRVKDQLKLHIMTKHTNYKPYKCKICLKTFAFKTILKSHSVVHTRERKFQCDYCGKSFVCNVTLRYHRRLHTGERPYRCSICGDGFVNSSRLKDHEQVKHIGKVQCPICLSTFSKRSTLKQHMDKLHPNTYVKGQKYILFHVNQ